MSFPVEIRLIIYRYLLYSWKFLITFHYSRRRRGGKLLGSVRHRGEGAGLQPAILRCSRQIHTEAVAVLYSENHFYYYSNEDNADNARPFPLHKLKLVRYLGVCIYENDMLDDDLQDIADATLALRRGLGLLLHFSLCFSLNSGCFDKGFKKRPLAIGVASNSMVLEGIFALDVRQELEIIVLDNKASTREIFQNLANAIAVAKNWYSIDKDGFYRDAVKGSYSKDDAEAFRCSWTFRPTPGAPPSAIARYLCRENWI